jgi:hypothetical protein
MASQQLVLTKETDNEFDEVEVKESKIVGGGWI